MKTIKLSDKQSQPCQLREGEIVTVIIKDVPYLMRVCEPSLPGCLGCSVRKHQRYINDELGSPHTCFTCEDINSEFICGEYIFVDVADILEDL